MANEELIQRLRNGLSCYGERCLSCPDRKHCVTYYEHEAADAIESLQLFVDLYQHLLDEKQRILKEIINKYPRWISVNERLPEETGKYLVCGRWRGKQTEIWVCEFMILDYLKGWVNNAANPPVTHWMRFSEPPKEKTK